MSGIMLTPLGRSIALISSSSASASGTTLVIAKPAGVVQGVLMVAFLAIDPMRSVTPPAGWTSQIDSFGRSVHTKVAGAGEAASYTWTFSATGTSQGFIVALGNADFDVIGSFSAGGTTVLAPSVTASTNGSLAFMFASDQPASITYSTPAGWTAFLADSDVNPPSMAIFSKQVDAGATGDVSSTSTPASTSRAILMVVKPT